jgi:DNA-directed RNA polymerase subunit RPC12/RpoP
MAEEEQAACPRCGSTNLDLREQRADRLVPGKDVITFCRDCGRDISVETYSL